MATRYSTAQLIAQADATLPDNVLQEISPADVRDMIKNFLMTMKTSFAALRRTSSSLLALSPVPIILAAWDVLAANDAPETVGNAAAGTITRQITTLGNPGAFSRITFYTGVSGTAGAELTFQIFANGAPTGIISRMSTTGSSNVVTAVLQGIDYQTVDVVYDVRVASSNSSNYTFTNSLFRVENEPVAAF